MKNFLITVLTKIENMAGAKPPTVTVLGYHSISNGKAIVDVAPDDFGAQIDFLESKFQFITLDQVVDYVKGKFKPEKPCVALTFDDGYADLLVSVAPMLAKHRIPETVFVLAKPESADRTQIRNTKKLMSMSDVKKLKKTGWTIGCHSATHVNFGGELDVKAEIRDAKRKLEKELGTEVRYFAYPKGIYNDKVIKAVKSAGYKASFTVDPGRVSIKNDIYKIPRIGVYRTHSMVEFAAFFTNWANVYFIAKSYLKARISI